MDGCIRLIRPRFAARIQLASFVDDSAKLIGPLETPPVTYSGGDILSARRHPPPLLLILALRPAIPSLKYHDASALRIMNDFPDLHRSRGH